MIKTGRYGKVMWDPTGAGGATLVQIASLNSFTLSLKTEYEDVSTFGDENRVYIPGLMDIGGTVEGYLDSADISVIAAAMQPTPGMLELIPNSSTGEDTFKFSGPAYMSAEIDASLEAPKLSGEFKGAGAWTIPSALP